LGQVTVICTTNDLLDYKEINNELIHWMKNEALSRNLPPDGYEGGLILDEMSIQSDLEFCSRDGNVYLWGFKEVTDKSYFKW
jgi:hypothetical protein